MSAFMPYAKRKKICGHCHREFITGRPAQKYCNRTCFADYRAKNGSRLAQEARCRKNSRRRELRRSNTRVHADYLARQHLEADIKRGHRSFSSSTERAEAINQLIETYARYQNPEVCAIRNCKEAATSWDEVIHGFGHRPGNVARLCWRHNKLKASMTLTDAQEIYEYIKNWKA